MNHSRYKFLLVEPVAKTSYPPLGLMKISAMLKKRYQGCQIIGQVGKSLESRMTNPNQIYITSLFTWDWKGVAECAEYYKHNFPNSEILIGGIGASLAQEAIFDRTGIKPHKGLYDEAEFCSPDYSLPFGRNNGASITFTSRGCPRHCEFCSVKELEPRFFVKEEWERDIEVKYPRIVFWDNNFLASPAFENDCVKIEKLNKTVDFNQGLDSRLLNEDRAKKLFKINIDPVRLAFDEVDYENAVLNAINIAKKYSSKEIMVYVLYNFLDEPEELYYRINLLNREGVLSFPMEYREPTTRTDKVPGKHWNTYLLRAFKLTLLFYYTKGMITRSRDSFLRIYGKNEREFLSRLYEIYNYDKKLKRKAQYKLGGNSNE